VRIVFYSLIYLEPVERFWNRRNVMKFKNYGDSMSSKVQDKLKTIGFSAGRLNIDYKTTLRQLRTRTFTSRPNVAYTYKVVFCLTNDTLAFFSYELVMVT